MPIGIAMRLIHTRNLPSFDGFAVSQIRPIAVSVNASTMRADIRITPTTPRANSQYIRTEHHQIHLCKKECKIISEIAQHIADLVFQSKRRHILFVLL